MKLRALLFFSFFFLPSFAFCSISGKYLVSGTQTNGEHYKGTSVIHQVGKSTYTLTWFFEDGSIVGTATGIKQGEHISFVFYDNSRMKYGVILYKIKNNVLRGVFTRYGETKTGQEKLKKITNDR
jgi:hypothetical protein